MENACSIDLSNITLEDLKEEYLYLWKRSQEQRKKNEADTQEIYELKRHLKTANATQAYLEEEIQQLTSAAPADTGEEVKKLRTDYDELRRKYNELDTAYLTQHQDNEALQQEVETLRARLEEMQSKEESTSMSEQTLNRMIALEQENMELLEKLQVLHEEATKQTMIAGHQEKNIEVLQDQLRCLEENLRCKREELEEKTTMLESAQEQVTELNAKVAMLMSASDNKNRKGNSLFAEVDDQRQVMRKLLEAQKKHYLQMKKAFNESEYEIRRLKRENSAMHTEMQTVSAIFCNADKTYHNKLNERLRHLHEENAALERKLKYTQEGLEALANDRGAVWIDSMLKFCKKETDDFKQELHSIRLQQASLEEQMRTSQQDMARWRFETLRLRCVVIDREALLTDNNIAFKPMNAYEFRATEEELSKARPRIFAPSKRTSLTAENSIDEQQAQPVDDQKRNLGDQPQFNIVPKPTKQESSSNEPSKEVTDVSVICLDATTNDEQQKNSNDQQLFKAMQESSSKEPSKEVVDMSVVCLDVNTIDGVQKDQMDRQQFTTSPSQPEQQSSPRQPSKEVVDMSLICLDDSVKPLGDEEKRWPEAADKVKDAPKSCSPRPRAAVCESSKKTLGFANDKENSPPPGNAKKTAIVKTPRPKGLIPRVSIERLEETDREERQTSTSPSRAAKAVDLDPSPTISSILSKGRDPFDMNVSEKYVHFSNKDTFHSPPKKNPADAKDNANSADTAKPGNSVKVTSLRTKSKVVISRGVCASKLIPRK